MSLTFPAGYWISKHTLACIFCSSTVIKSYTRPAAPPPPNLGLTQVERGIVKFGVDKVMLYGGEPLDVLLSFLSLHLYVITVKRRNQLPMRVQYYFPAVRACRFLLFFILSTACLLPWIPHNRCGWAATSDIELLLLSSCVASVF